VPALLSATYVHDEVPYEAEASRIAILRSSRPVATAAQVLNNSIHAIIPKIKIGFFITATLFSLIFLTFHAIFKLWL